MTKQIPWISIAHLNYQPSMYLKNEKNISSTPKNLSICMIDKINLLDMIANPNTNNMVIGNSGNRSL